MWNFGKLALSSFALSALAFSACKEEPTSNPPSIFYDLHIEMSWWGSIEKARQAYPNLHPNEARETYTNEQRYEYFRSEKDPHKRHLMAAIIYLDYAQENTRARIAQCESLGVDISAFESNFEGQHKSEDSATDLILGQHNISRDMVWDRNKLEMMANANNNLLVIGGLKDTAVICADIKSKPQTFAQRFYFANDMPIVAAQLKQAQANAQIETKPEELATVPALRN